MDLGERIDVSNEIVQRGGELANLARRKSSRHLERHMKNMKKVGSSDRHTIDARRKGRMSSGGENAVGRFLQFSHCHPGNQGRVRGQDERSASNVDHGRGKAVLPHHVSYDLATGCERR